MRELQETASDSNLRFVLGIVDTISRSARLFRCEYSSNHIHFEERFFVIKPIMPARLSLVVGMVLSLLLTACSSANTSSSTTGVPTTSSQGKSTSTATAVSQNASQLAANFAVGNIAPPSSDSQHVSVFAKFTTATGQDVRLGNSTTITCNGVVLAYTPSGAYNSNYTTNFYTATISSSADAYHFVYTANGKASKADIKVPPAPTITAPVANARIPVGHVTITFAATAHAIAFLGFATDSRGDTSSGTLISTVSASSSTYPLNTGDFPTGKGTIALTVLESATTVTSDFANTTVNIVVTTTIAVIWVAA